MHRKELIKQIQNKRLIFTVTTGRSGTAYLAAVFRYMKGVHSYHEPPPEYVKVLRGVQTNPLLATRFLIEEKLPAIAENPTNIYVETSHLACKGFLEPLLELGIVPDIVIHRRPMRDIAKSLYKHNAIPGRVEKALLFYLMPDDPDVIGLEKWEEMDDYQLCYWYCIEIERRARKYKKLFLEKGATVAETSLAGLKTSKGLNHLLTALKLSLKFPAWLTRLRYLRNSRFKINENRETVKRFTFPEKLSELEREVVSRLDPVEKEKWFADITL